MFKKKLLTITMAAVLALSTTACNRAKETNADPSTEPTQEVQTEATNVPTEAPTAAPTQVPTEEPTQAPVVQEPKAPAGYVIDFEDGKYDFAMINAQPIKADAGATIELADFNGSKALKVNSDNGKFLTYLGIDLSSLVGSKIADVRTIEADIAVDTADGSFYACSGYILTYTGENNKEKGYPWSVYMESKNPKTATVTLDADLAFVEGAKNIVIFSKDVDNRFTAVGETTSFYIDNIVFRDASGNPIAVDTSASFDAPDGFGESTGSGPFSSNAIEVMKAMDSGTEEGKMWFYQLTDLAGMGTLKQIIFQLVGPFSEPGWIGGEGAVGINYGEDGWYEVNYSITEAEDNLIVIDIPADIAEQIVYDKEGAQCMIGFWWGSSNTCTLTKVEFSDGSRPSGNWSANKVEVMKDMDCTTDEGKMWQYPLSNLIGKGPIKNIVFQLVGPFSEAGDISGNGSVGISCGDEWYQADYQITEDDNMIIIDIPADKQELLDYEKDGIVQIGFWWGSSTTCTLTYVDFIE